jgi:GxxExxY protein
MTENEIGKIIVDSAITVHRELGAGLLETVYEVILSHELQQRGLHVERQVPVPIEIRGIRFDEAFRADIVVEGKVVLELKSIEQVTRVHKKQLQTYLRLTGYKLGFLLNFGETLMKKGITRAVNGLDEDPLPTCQDILGAITKRPETLSHPKVLKRPR